MPRRSCGATAENWVERLGHIREAAMPTGDVLVIATPQGGGLGT